MKVLVYTLGCKLNQCESEAIADSFAREGFTVVGPSDRADLCIVNTCTVTGKAEQKARRMIRKYAAEEQRPVVLVTGCYAQMERQALERLADRVVVVSLDDKPSLLGLPGMLAGRVTARIDLLDAVREFTVKEDSFGKRRVVSPFDYDAVAFTYHSRAFLKIQDGCDNACAYCRVTIARGPAVSLGLDEVVRRAVALEAKGYREIVLTGVNISAYRSGDSALSDLIDILLATLGPDVRIRLSSLEPDMLDDNLIGRFADRRIQPHFHLPVQSGSDAVLLRANRHYDVARLIDAIHALRRMKQDPFIAADIITGLPGETDSEFARTVDVIRATDLSRLHVFPFSPRPQTAFCNAPDQVPENVRSERARFLRDLSAIHLRRYMDRQTGRNAEVIVEENTKGTWTGLTGNYLKVRLTDTPPDIRRGALLPVVLCGGQDGGIPYARCLNPSDT